MTKIVLFDVDGVLLSEERYFDASALTVWELLSSERYLGLAPKTFTPSPKEQEIRRIRQNVFVGDRVLHLLKQRGVNANWDMVYLTFCTQLIELLAKLKREKPGVVNTVLEADDLDEKTLALMRGPLNELEASPNYQQFLHDFAKTDAHKQQLISFLNKLCLEKTGKSGNGLFSRNSRLWEICRLAFQEWYLGSERAAKAEGHAPLQAGKRGFLHDEIPVVPPEDVRRLFRDLKRRGISIGIGTGRPRIETMEPLSALDLLADVDSKRIVTATDVLEAERAFPERAPLAKPHPFSYVYGWLGKETPPKQVLDYPLPLKDGKDLVVVGDSIADFYAADAIGCRFAAVLTGLSGQKARADFAALGCRHILNDVREVDTIL